MAVGKGASLVIDGFDVHDHAVSIANSYTPEEVDATVVSSQKRVAEPSYDRNVLTVTFKWSPAVQAFVDAHSTDSGDEADYLDLPYTYGPAGDQTGKVKISGLGNVVANNRIPGSVPGQLTTLEFRLNLNTAVTGVFA